MTVLGGASVAAAGVFIVGAAAAQQESPGPSETLGTTTLTLRSRSGMCELQSSPADGRAEAQSITLRIPWPCDFHRNPAGRLRVHRSGQSAYVLVQSSKPRETPGLERERVATLGCETQLQSLRIDGGVSASPHIERVAACPPFQWDAFVFTALFGK